MNNGFEIKNNKMYFEKDNFGKCEIIAMVGKNVLLKSSINYEQYIIGSGFDFNTKEWKWGHYFSKKEQALECFRENYINPVIEREAENNEEMECD